MQRSLTGFLFSAKYELKVMRLIGIFEFCPEGTW